MSRSKLEYARSRWEHDPRSDAEGEHQVRSGRVSEEELGHRQAQVVLAVAHHAQRVGFGRIGEIRMRVHAGLGRTGRAGGEEPAGQIVRSRRLGIGQAVAGALGGQRLLVARKASGLLPDNQQRLSQARPVKGRSKLAQRRTVRDRDAGLGVREVLLELSALLQRIDHREDSARAQDGKPGLRKLKPIGEDDEHALLGTKSQAAQGGGQPPRALDQLGEGLRTPPRAQRDLGTAAFLDVVIEEVLGQVEAPRKRRNCGVKRVGAHGAPSLAVRCQRSLLPPPVPRSSSVSQKER